VPDIKNVNFLIFDCKQNPILTNNELSYLFLEELTLSGDRATKGAVFETKDGLFNFKVPKCRFLWRVLSYPASSLSDVAFGSVFNDD